MKKVLSLLLVMISMSGVSKTFAQASKTDSFKVYGNCNMCKKRIDKAALIDGVSKADWNVETKIMTVTYNATKVKNEAIQQKVAAAGHDTEKEKAADNVYSKLPGCCQYERKAGGNTPAHDHHK